MKTNYYVIAALFSTATLAKEAKEVKKDCSASISGKVECGWDGVDQNACEAKGCCWEHVHKDKNSPKSVNDPPVCFY